MNNQQTKNAAQTLTDKSHALMTTTERVKFYLPYLLLAVILVTAFFAHESIFIDQTETDLLRTEWIEAKSKRTKALDVLKKLTENTPEYQTYLNHKNETNELFTKLEEAKVKDEFVGFPNFKYFIGEFGWALGLFIIGIYMAVRDIVRNTKTLFPEMLINTTVIGVSLFFMSWTLIPKQDFSKLTYVIFNFVLAIVLSTGTYLLVKHRLKYTDRLRFALESMIKFCLKWGWKIQAEQRMEYKEDLFDTSRKAGISK